MLTMRQATAPLTVKILRERLFQNFEVPGTIISNNGSQFTGNVFRNLCFSYDIRHVTTTLYRPQGSHVEKFNRNLRAAMIAHHAELQTSWDREIS